ncbi:unnamed protein product [Spirodela intermedia]|uniref:Wbp11/ELF5/Saf1 N-terminal domain-containing protein n=1 Tax=Spirodela intermedia TaxID=51605 RepID=A0A7I8I8R9_SPIIN|nr:unnamed protein product [Spirodela intermedia]CAA6654067.1 unnamed protein product [Spirodela intermedia]
MKTTKGGKVMNPTDAYRKELRKKELKRNKKERKKVREVGILKKDPEAIKDQIQKLEMMKADGALDKARKHKKRQLEDTLNLVMKKRKEYEEKAREKGETSVMFSHLGPPRRLTTAEEEEKVKHPQPEDSVYYHPTLNPTGAPPPGKPPMYKSSLGPEIPSSSSAAASTSNPESEEMPLAAPPPPPPPPPLPDSGLTSADDSDFPLSMPPPPPPPPPTQPKLSRDSSLSLPPHLIPPPPPGPPPKESLGIRPMMPPLPPPPVQPPTQSAQDEEDEEDAESKNLGGSGEVVKIPPPPPPPGLPPKQTSHQSMTMNPESIAGAILDTNNLPKMVLPPPPRQPPPGPIRFPLQPDVLPPGVSHIPSAAPLLDMSRPPLPPLHGHPGQPFPPGIMTPLSPGHPFPQEDEMFLKPQKPSYVKSAASTVVKRPLAQHNSELTSMVPASVRVRRETATAPRAKPKAQLLVPGAGPSRQSAPAAAVKSESASAAPPKMPSMDDSYMAFLEDMKALGALDG